MTMEQTVKILAMLRGFYPTTNIDSKLMATMWHLVIGEYEYGITQRAVINFVKNDERTYATFPTPAMIIKSIKQERSIGQGIYNAIYFDKDYDGLTDEAKSLISKHDYNELRLYDKDELVSREKEIVAKILTQIDRPILIEGAK